MLSPISRFDCCHRLKKEVKMSMGSFEKPDAWSPEIEGISLLPNLILDHSLLVLAILSLSTGRLPISNLLLRRGLLLGRGLLGVVAVAVLLLGSFNKSQVQSPGSEEEIGMNSPALRLRDVAFFFLPAAGEASPLALVALSSGITARKALERLARALATLPKPPRAANFSMSIL